MKAVITTAYGSPDVMQLQEVEKPTPKANEVLVKIHATSINFGDLYARTFNKVSPSEFSMPGVLWPMVRLVMGIRKPRVKIMGSEFSGVVEAKGSDVRLFDIGDEVFGYLAMKMGAYADYITISEDGVIAHKPRNLTFEQAAVIPYGTITALGLLSKANIQSGQKVLINGASGAIGSAALQLAKHYGAEVTGVCSTPRMEYVKKLGADHVIDYTTEDFIENGETYDLILDVLRKTTFDKCKESLASNGIYMLASFKMKQVRQMIWTSQFSDKKVMCVLAPESKETLLQVKTLAESGVVFPVIDRSFSLDKAADAHRYVESGQKQGNVAIKVSD